jgi:ABC-type transporter Mla maintaining outer membrane lipid asymmetry ATPase subunit MlaF
LTPPPLVELTDVSKNYHGLRPLRIEKLTIGDGELVAILGLDQPMAETFINLVTGAALPDRGEITIFGRPTTSISDSADWLSMVDRFGIVSTRAVLLDALSVIQNLSIPFTLDVDPPPDDVRERASLLAREAGLRQPNWLSPVSELDAGGRIRVHAGRALALDPKMLLFEHADAGLPSDVAIALGGDMRQIASRRGCGLVALTVDPQFAFAVATKVLALDPASGRLSDRRRKSSFFTRR